MLERSPSPTLFSNDYLREINELGQYFGIQDRLSISPSKHHVVDYIKALEFFGIPPSLVVKCPLCEYMEYIHNIIPHLNDESIIYTDIDPHGFTKTISTHGKDFKFIGKWLEELGY